MRETTKLIPTKCAICGTSRSSDELYPATVEPDEVDSAIYSARRVPDRIHYRIVTCRKCSLVRSDPVLDPDLMANLYAESRFTYESELSNLRRTYGDYLRKLEDFQDRKEVLLEIGCGNGFLLEEAESQGYSDVWGVEPSSDAIAQASPRIRPKIKHDVMRPSLFPPNTFTTICLFQVFDHVPNPREVLGACYDMLVPGGLILFLQHNVKAFSARILRERSPIFDVEHTYLYSPKTLARLLQAERLTTVRSGLVLNRYSLQYLARLLPSPPAMKSRILSIFSGSIGRISVLLPLGNFYLIARKSRSS